MSTGAVATATPDSVSATCGTTDGELGPLSCTIHRDFAALEPLRNAWDDAVVQAGGSVYMTFDWVRTWWAFYGGSATLRVFMFSVGGRTVAIVPLYIDTFGWGPMRLRVARLVGANIPPKVFDPPVPAWCASIVMDHVVEQLFVHDRCDVLSFGPVSSLHHWKASVSTVCRDRKDVMAGEAARGIYSVFELPADMEEYYASLSKNERKNRRKYDLRLLRKEYDVRVEVVRDPWLTEAEFERFAEQHRQQWFHERKTGHFGAWPRALEFNRALVKSQARAGRLRFIRIVANGEVVANQYTFVLGNRYYWELPSRAVDAKWDRFSLGPSALVTMFAQAIADGIRRVEGGLAHYDYKVRLGAKEHDTLTLRIVNRGRLSRIRVEIFSALRDLVEVAYHKVWYRRIMPRLAPPAWRAQSRLWLRLDF